MKLSIDLLPLEIKPINNVLSYVFYDIEIQEFEKKISVSLNVARDLLDRVYERASKIPIGDYKTITHIAFERWEVEVILNAIKEVFLEVEDWEFQTLFIVDIPQMQAIERKLVAALNVNSSSTL